MRLDFSFGVKVLDAGRHFGDWFGGPYLRVDSADFIVYIKKPQGKSSIESYKITLLLVIKRYFFIDFSSELIYRIRRLTFLGAWILTSSRHFDA